MSIELHQSLYKMKNPIILWIIICAIILGIIHGWEQIQLARSTGRGVKESKNIFSFFFFDRY